MKLIYTMIRHLLALKFFSPSYFKTSRVSVSNHVILWLVPFNFISYILTRSHTDNRDIQLSNYCKFKKHPFRSPERITWGWNITVPQFLPKPQVTNTKNKRNETDSKRSWFHNNGWVLQNVQAELPPLLRSIELRLARWRQELEILDQTPNSDAKNRQSKDDSGATSPSNAKR